MTPGFQLPHAKWVIHTVGPIGEKPALLSSCYTKSLDCAAEIGATSVAFPCISTGVYGYPVQPACRVAAAAVRDWLQKHPNANIDVTFCTFSQSDFDVFEDVLIDFNMLLELEPEAAEQSSSSNEALR